MTDTTDIKALRERLVGLNRTYALISSPSTMEQANTSAHMFVKSGGINHIIAALDQIEAERQRADVSTSCLLIDAQQLEIQRLSAELAELKGDQVPVGKFAGWGVYRADTDDFGSWLHTRPRDESDHAIAQHGYVNVKLFTAPQKLVVLQRKVEAKFIDDFERGCIQGYNDAIDDVEAAGGVVKEAE